MTYGISIKNSNGLTVLDGSSPVYTEISSGTLNVNEDNYRTYQKEVPIPSGYSDYVIAFLLPEGKLLSFWDNIVYASKSTGTANVPYKVFAPVKQVTPSNDSYGLRIYNVNGELVFDSGRKVFNVLSNHLFDITTTKSYIFTNTNNEWVIPATGGIRGLRQVSTTGGVFLAGFIQQDSDNTVRAQIGDFAFGPIPESPIAVTGTGCCLRVRIT